MGGIGTLNCLKQIQMLNTSSSSFGQALILIWQASSVLQNDTNVNVSLWKCLKSQSVENPGVAFVKGANERNEFFKKKKNKQTVMYDEQVRTNKANH